MISISIAGIERAQRRLLAQKRRAVDGVWSAVEESARVVKASADRRAIVARQTNIQDAPRMERLARRSPVRLRSVRSAMTVFVTLANFWTNAKSPAIRSLYAKHGLGSKLMRRYLWIDPERRAINRTALSTRGSKTASRQSKRQRAQHTSRIGLKRRLLQKGLLAWAMGRSRAGNVGDQHLVSVVRPPSVVRRDLVLGPAARQHNRSTIARIRAALNRATRT